MTRYGKLKSNVLSHKIRQETNKVRDTTSPSVRASVESSNLVRKYMLFSAWARIGNITGFVMSATGVMFSDPLVFALVFTLLLFLPSLLCSTVQLLIVVEITPTESKRQLLTEVAATALRDSGVTVTGGVAGSPRKPRLSMTLDKFGNKKHGWRTRREIRNSVVSCVKCH